MIPKMRKDAASYFFAVGVVILGTILCGIAVSMIHHVPDAVKIEQRKR